MFDNVLLKLIDRFSDSVFCYFHLDSWQYVWCAEIFLWASLECVGNVIFWDSARALFRFPRGIFFLGAEFLGSPLNGAE